jgi:pSer/pThr/pTyr-binding forkhead associated (FHA) protein
MRARLVPTGGGTPIDLVKDLTLVGRGENCDLRVDHKSVSKLHCVIVKTDGVLLIRDLGSTNGTRVNGQRVRRAALLPNDNLAVAHVRYDVKFGVDADLDLEMQSMPVVLDESGVEDEPLRRNSLPDVYPDEPKK